MAETATNTMPEGLRDVRAAASSSDVRTARALMAVGAGAVAGMLGSGFWNVRAVDGLGLALFVTPVIGAFEGRAETFAATGSAFGVLRRGRGTRGHFHRLEPGRLLDAAGAAGGTREGAAAHLARSSAGRAAHQRRHRRRDSGCVLRTAGSGRGEAFHTGPIPQCAVVRRFRRSGTVAARMVGGGRGSGRTAREAVHAGSRYAWRQPAAIAALTGRSSVLLRGRPLAVFRERCSTPRNPRAHRYRGVHDRARRVAITVGVSVVLMLLAGVGGRHLTAWVQQRPEQARLIAAAALAAGGSFLIFYWAVTRIWPAMGRWGFGSDVRVNSDRDDSRNNSVDAQRQACRTLDLGEPMKTRTRALYVLPGGVCHGSGGAPVHRKTDRARDTVSCGGGQHLGAPPRHSRRSHDVCRGRAADTSTAQRRTTACRARWSRRRRADPAGPRHRARRRAAQVPDSDRQGIDAAARPRQVSRGRRSSSAGWSRRRRIRRCSSNTACWSASRTPGR